MASVTLKLSSVRNKDNGKSEVLLRYRNTRTIALRAHTHIYVLPKFFQDGEIVIKNRLMTKEVQEAQEAKATLDRIVNHVLDKGTGKAIEDRLFDRDTLLLREYEINLIFLIAAYGSYEDH